jgi:phosphoribosylaminoimidazole-succinocarboxamide synthase
VGSTDISSAVLPGFVEKRVGKVRDQYICEDVVVMVATDRQSAFDRQLAQVPFKGQVLNLTSKWWFDNTNHIIGNHLLATPKANICIGKKCTIFPIEFVMRGYITGSTDTSIWMNYRKGVRDYCGHHLPEGMVKNQKLWTNLLTPTTKVPRDNMPSHAHIQNAKHSIHTHTRARARNTHARTKTQTQTPAHTERPHTCMHPYECTCLQSDIHDELISAEELVKRGFMSQVHPHFSYQPMAP